jgi:hypothetical protein
VFRHDVSNITTLETNNIFTINLMPEIKVSFTFGTCLKPHGIPPRYFIAGKPKVLLELPLQ